MEDIPRDIQRDIARIRNTPVPKRKRRWTLLFVGDTGEVITIHHFKAWVVFYFALLTAAVAAAAVLWFNSRSPRNENRRLTRELSIVQEQLAAVKAEKDLMMARMVVSASRNAVASESPSPATAVGETKAAAEGPSKPVKTPAPVSAAQTMPSPPAASPVIDVEDLRVSHDVDNKMLHAQFMLKKADTDQETVTGRTFVILKTEMGAAVRWLSMPAVPLEEGRPSRVRNGRYFSISRFNIVKFSTPYGASTDAFTNAAILVYSLQGELMLEKPFDIRVTLGPSPDQDIGE